jgi:hypothetical protein
VLRRLFLLAPAGWFGWRVHVLARHDCANGPVLTLLLRGEPWKLTERERDLIDRIAELMRHLEPTVMQEKIPRA